MISAYLRLYIRNLAKNLLSIGLAVNGLALAIAVSLIAILFISNELNFDGFHKNSGSVYRLVFGDNDGNGSAYTSAILGRTLAANYPETKVVSFSNAGSARVPFRYEDKSFIETSFYFTDAEIFNVFSFSLKKGDPAECLKMPFTMVLTENASHRYFGDSNPVGKAITIDWGGVSYHLNITGILNNIPSNSHLKFDFLISQSTAEQIFEPKSLFTDWTANFLYNYVYLPDNNKKESIETTLRKIYTASMPADLKRFDVRLQPMNRIHLFSKLNSEISKNNDIQYVYLAASLSVLILVISFINYFNILFAVYAKRVKELNVRKVLGARGSDIGFQFAIESAINLAISMILAGIIYFSVSAYFSNLLNSDLSLVSIQYNRTVILTSLGCILILVCTYVTFIFSRIRIISLAGAKPALFSDSNSKGFLVGLQVAISLILIVGSIAIRLQLDFLHAKELGFDKENVLAVPYGRVITNKIELARNELAGQHGILSMSLTSQIPPANLNFMSSCFPDQAVKNPGEPWNVPLLAIDRDFVRTYNLRITSGRSFSNEFKSDSSESFMVNEAFAKELGWADPVGRTIEVSYNPGTGNVERKRGKIIGVLADFHFESLYKTIAPIIFINRPSAYYYVSFRLAPGGIQPKLDYLRTKWKSLFPDTPFEYIFIDQRLNSAYKTEKAWADSIHIFSILAVLIACLGLYGLISFMVLSQRKEITIRKVLGATQQSIMILLSLRIMKIVVIAFILSLPLCLYFINDWLNGFAYHIRINAGIFLYSFCGFSMITLLVISSNVLKGAKISVAQNLKRE